MSQPIAPPLEGSLTRNPFSTLPPGWTTEADPKDGRLFYWHAATGTSCWTHPNADPKNRIPPRSPAQDDSSFHYMPAPYWTGTPSNAPPNATTTTTTTSKAVPLPPPSENPYMASRRPDNHQCGAIAALVLCPPLGIFALYHSMRVDACWKTGQYSDAVIHSRQSPQYSSWGIMIGIIFGFVGSFFVEDGVNGNGPTGNWEIKRWQWKGQKVRTSEQSTEHARLKNCLYHVSTIGNRLLHSEFCHTTILL